MATIGKPQNSRTKYLSTYSQTLLYGHLLNTDTSLLRTVCFVPGERKPLHFHYKNPTRLIYIWTPVNTDSFYAPLSVRIIGVSPYSCHAQFLLPPALPGATWEEGL